jgi:hypothetical protein
MSGKPEPHPPHPDYSRRAGQEEGPGASFSWGERGEPKATSGR